MNLFQAVKETLTTRQVAEAYGIDVKHNGMCCCPFHNEKHPSMKVDQRYHCFSCGEDGDVIDFVSKYFSLSKYAAALKLSEDFSISYEQWTPEQKTQWCREKLRPRPKTSQQIYREKEQLFFRTISDYYHLLKKWKEVYAPKTIDDTWDDRFVEALDMLPRFEQLMDQFLTEKQEGRMQLFKENDDLFKHCEKRLHEIRGEKTAHLYQPAI